MADITQVTLSDGNTYRLPAYAMEVTAQAILKELKDVSSDTDTIRAILEKYTKINKADLELRKKSEEETRDVIRDEAEETRKENAKNTQAISNAFLNAIGYLDTMIFRSLAVTGGLLATTVGLVVGHTMKLGDTVAELSNFGMGFEAGRDNIVSTISSLNMLGLSTGDAAGTLQEFSGVVATQGQNSFLMAAQSLNEVTAGGSLLGLTMKEMISVYGDDMKLRQRAGITDLVNAEQAAKASAQLYADQKQYTRILGISISEIQAASDELMNDTGFMMSINRLAMTRTGTAANEMLTQVQDSMSRLKATGMDDQMMGMVTDILAGPGMLFTEGGQQMFTAMQMIGTEGSKAALSAMDEMQRALESGDPEAMARAEKRLENAMAQIGQNFTNMSPEQLKQIKLLAQTNPALMSVYNSAMQARMSQERKAQVDREVTKLSKQQAEAMGKTTAGLVDIAIGAKQYENAMSRLDGTMDSVMNSISGAFGPVFASFVSEMTERLPEFQEIMSRFGSKLIKAFGGLSGTVGEMEQGIGKFIDGMLKKLGNWVDRGGPEQVVNAFAMVGGVFENIGLAIAGLAGFFESIGSALGAAYDTISSIFGSNDETDEKLTPVEQARTLGKTIGDIIVNFAMLSLSVKALSKVFLLAQGAKGLFSMFGGASSAAGGAAGSAASTAAGAAGGGVGKLGRGIASLGKGIGKSIGGILEGIATGLSAFANPKILVGAGIFSASIVAIGAAVAGATWMMGKALPTFAEGLESFDKINGDNLQDVGLGMIGLGAGLAAMGAGSVMSAVGNLVGGLFDKLNSALGGSDIMTKLVEFSKFQVDTDAVKRNAEAVVAYGKAMSVIGAGEGLSGIGGWLSFVSDSLVKLFGGDTPLEKVKKFSEMTFDVEGIKANAAAIGVYGIAMAKLGAIEIPGNSFGAFMGQIYSSLLGWFGAESPMEKLTEFGSENINAAGIKLNASAIILYAQAMSDLAGVNVDNLDQATKGLTSKRTEQALQRLKSFGDTDISAQSVKVNTSAIAMFANEMKNVSEIDADAVADKIMKIASAYNSFNILNVDQIREAATVIKQINNEASVIPNGVQSQTQTANTPFITAANKTKPNAFVAPNLSPGRAVTTPRPDQESVKPIEQIINMDTESLNNLDPGTKEMISLLARVVANTEQAARTGKRTVDAINDLPG